MTGDGSTNPNNGSRVDTAESDAATPGATRGSTPISKSPRDKVSPGESSRAVVSGRTKGPTRLDVVTTSFYTSFDGKFCDGSGLTVGNARSRPAIITCGPAVTPSTPNMKKQGGSIPNKVGLHPPSRNKTCEMRNVCEPDMSGGDSKKGKKGAREHTAGLETAVRGAARGRPLTMKCPKDKGILSSIPSRGADTAPNTRDTSLSRTTRTIDSGTCSHGCRPKYFFGGKTFRYGNARPSSSFFNVVSLCITSRIDHGNMGSSAASVLAHALLSHLADLKGGMDASHPDHQR